MLSWARRYALARAFGPGGRRWGPFAAALVGAGLLRRIATRQERRVLREELAPGESMLVRHLPPTR